MKDFVDLIVPIICISSNTFLIKILIELFCFIDLVFRKRKLTMERDMQTDNFLHFADCDRCRMLAGQVLFLYSTAKIANDNKENDLNWKLDYNLFLDQCYYLDLHMNKVHRKLKKGKFHYGQIPLIGEIVILSELADVKLGEQIIYGISWYNNFSTCD